MMLEHRKYLEEKIKAPGQVKPSICNPILFLTTHYQTKAILAYAQGDLAALGREAWAAAQCQAQYINIDMFGLRPDKPPYRSVSIPARHVPLALAQSLAWDDGWARQFGHSALHVAERNRQELKPDVFAIDLGRPSYPAFILALYRDACHDEAPYVPENMLPDYAELLANWRSEDPRALIEPVTRLIPYRELQYVQGDEDQPYRDYDLAFPWEILAIQRLRQQLGLPEVEYGIVNIDIPWRVIRDFDKSTPPPEEVTLTIARIQQDFPDFPAQPTQRCTPR